MSFSVVFLLRPVFSGTTKVSINSFAVVVGVVVVGVVVVVDVVVVVVVLVVIKAAVT